MTKRLYILGNGFDLHHCLRTSYCDFAEFLKENNKNLYETLERYISFPSSDKNLWSRFEENLANLDAEEILSEHTDTLPNYASENFEDGDKFVFPNTINEYYQKLTNGLFSEFEAFIRNVDLPKTAFEFKIELDEVATFLTFNYTDTLERLYQIDEKQILYIHNSVFYSNEGIVLGHGIDPKNFEEEKPTPPDGVSDEELESWHEQHDDYDYSYDTGKETLMQYFKDTYKPSQEIIQRHASFFKSIAHISEVYVLGHSISPVDLTYFDYIVKSIDRNAKWFVSYYDNQESKRHFETLM